MSVIIDPVGSSLAPSLSEAAPAAEASSGLLASLTGGLKGLVGGLGGLASGLFGGLTEGVPMSATSGGSYIAGGPTIGARVVGGKGVSAATSATQEASAGDGNIPALAAGGSGPAPNQTGTLIMVGLVAAALVAVALIFTSKSRR